MSRVSDLEFEVARLRTVVEALLKELGYTQHYGGFVNDKMISTVTPTLATPWQDIKERIDALRRGLDLEFERVDTPPIVTS